MPDDDGSKKSSRLTVGAILVFLLGLIYFMNPSVATLENVLGLIDDAPQLSALGLYQQIAVLAGIVLGGGGLYKKKIPVANFHPIKILAHI